MLCGFAGTSERVCLISGTIESIMAVLDFITFKIREKPDKPGVEHDAKMGEREKQVSLIVPRDCCSRHHIQPFLNSD